MSPELPLLRGTVLENIAGAAADDDDDWIATVVDACALTRDLALGAGLETRVSEQGANLSEGLRRRIRIARAIAMRPRLLLIDEPGLSTDPISSTALANAASLSGATILIVGPEANDRLRIDQVWHLPEGRSERARSPSNVIEGFARRLGGTLGRAKIVNLPPGRRVLAHVDRGDYYARRDRFHLVIESDGCRMRAGGEEVVMQRGELWWFDNKAEHEAWNETASPRIHLIFDIEPPIAD